MVVEAERPRAPEQAEVEAMFDDIVARYDLLNRLLSLGLDRRWRSIALASLDLPPATVVLDLGCGSGDLVRALAARYRPVGVDVSQQMLRLAQRRAGRPTLVRGSAFALPFADGAFAGVVSAFVLRNLRDLAAAFREVARVLAPGGRIALLDATEPANPIVRPLFDAYFGLTAPMLGALFGKGRAYRYLVRSLAHLPPGQELAAMLERAGLEHARARPLDFGAVTLLTARKPAR